jgi:hypothetical protein
MKMYRGSAGIINTFLISALDEGTASGIVLSRVDVLRNIRMCNLHIFIQWSCFFLYKIDEVQLQIHEKGVLY